MKYYIYGIMGTTAGLLHIYYMAGRVLQPMRTAYSLESPMEQAKHQGGP